MRTKQMICNSNGQSKLYMNVLYLLQCLFDLQIVLVNYQRC